MKIFYKKEGVYIDIDKIEGLIPIIDNNYYRWCLIYDGSKYFIEKNIANIIKEALETQNNYNNE